MTSMTSQKTTKSQSSSRPKLSSLWTQHLRGEEKQKFEDYLRGSTTIIDRLRRIIEDFEHEVYLNESAEADYTDKDWMFLQAHRNGKKEALRKLKKLTDHVT